MAAVLRIQVLLLVALALALMGGIYDLKPRYNNMVMYKHEISSCPNASNEVVARTNGSDSSIAAFRMIVIIDNPVTEELSSKSAPVGRLQGMFASVDRDSSELNFQLYSSIVLSNAQDNGSTLQLFGTNHIFQSSARDIPIIGGTSKFAHARGIATLQTSDLMGIIKFTLRFFSDAN